MKSIVSPIKPQDQGAAVANLQAALIFIVEKRGLAPEKRTCGEWQKALANEIAKQAFGKRTKRLLGGVLKLLKAPGAKSVTQRVADILNRELERLGAFSELDRSAAPAYAVSGVVRLADGSPGRDMMVSAFDLDLRSEDLLGRAATGDNGTYQIKYKAEQFSRRESDSADLVVKAFSADGALLATSPVLFNAPPKATIDLTIPVEMRAPPALFEEIGAALPPLTETVNVEELEEDEKNKDLTFLSGETGFEKRDLARYVLAQLLTRQGVQAEFWFALLGGGLFEYKEEKSLKEQLAKFIERVSAVEEASVRKAIAASFGRNEIARSLRDGAEEWIAAFLKVAARTTVGPASVPSFVRDALEDAGIKGATKQAKFALLFSQYKGMTPELVATLQKDRSFTKAEIANVQTSYQLADLTRGDFLVVKAIKEEFGVSEPEQVRTLAAKSEKEWVDLVKRGEAAETLTIPEGLIQPTDSKGKAAGPRVSSAELYGKTLERQFREAFPTTAFAGGLGRSLSNGGARGLRQGAALHEFLQQHENFELLTTPIDAFLQSSVNPGMQELAQNEQFRTELKAVQRVFKLAPTFEATNTLLADDLHSAQKVYRAGESEFVQRYGNSPGFTPETARLAWNRAADTHAAVLTIVGELQSFNAEGLPAALRTEVQTESRATVRRVAPTARAAAAVAPAAAASALANFPNWNNLFQGGDLCECEHCRSVLSPAAYFADLLTFLKDRKAANPADTVKDVLFRRRPDLGYLELNCENALTPLPYVDVVCEVLEAAVDNNDDNELQLTGFTVISSNPATAKSTVSTALQNAFGDPANDGKEKLALGDNFSLTQVNPADPDRWIAHGDDVTYLLRKKTTGPDFFAAILRNTKASAEELRAYPQYVNPKAYKILRQAKYPQALPFDLFGAEVRAGFQKSNLQRWDLMETFRGNVAPNNPTDGEIAAEYFGISVDGSVPLDEKRLILVSKPTVAWQRAVWGETGPGWLASIGNVKNFLQKTHLEYNELLALLDLKFINPAGSIIIQHLDPSCDLAKKVITPLNRVALDRMHRFLRMWRKLDGWKMWELDLVLRHPRIGHGALNEPFLINLFYFERLRKRLGGKTSVEQVCALFGHLDTETRFTKLYEKRDDALYQNLFLNRRLTNPIDPAFRLTPLSGDLAPGDTISAHHPVVLAALGLRETDLVVLKQLTKASDGAPYITDDLSLSNLSFLWRHAWLAKLLKFKADEWRTILKLLQQDLLEFTSPKAAWEFFDEIDLLKAAGFSPDELNWLLAADRSAKAATKEADAARFLAGLRKDLQAIRAEYDPGSAAYSVLSPPSNVDGLNAIVRSLLQKLNRDEAEADLFLKALRGPVLLEADTPELGATFAFDPTITGTPNFIPITYEWVLRFAGLMSDGQRTTLLNDPLLANVTGIQSYQEAIEDLFNQASQATVTGLPAGFAFPSAITDAPTTVAPLNQNIPIRCQPVLRLRGVMTVTQRTALLHDASLAPASNAIEELFQQSATVGDNFVTVDASWSGPLNLPPALVSLPMRATAQKIVFAGVMMDAERLALQAAGIPSSTVDELFWRPRLAVKFYKPIFTAALDALPPAVDFKAQLPAELALKVSYDPEEGLLRFAGIMSDAERLAIDALVPVLPAEPAYHNAVASLATQPQAIVPTDERVWLTDDELAATVLVGNATNSLAKRLAIAAKRALADLSKTVTANTVVQQTSAKLGLTEAVARDLLGYSVLLPDSMLTYLTGTFVGTSGAMDYVTQKKTFDGWYWLARVATILKRWKLTLAELKTIATLAGGAQLLDFLALPLSDAAAIAPVDRFLRTRRLLKLRDILPETGLTLLEFLEQLNNRLSTVAVSATGLPASFAFPPPITATIPIQYDSVNLVFRFTGLMSPKQRATLLHDSSLASVTSLVTYRQAIDGLFQLLMGEAAAIELLNEDWPASEVATVIASLDLTYPADYLLAENWERLRKAFYFIDNLNAGVEVVKTFGGATVGDTHAKVLKELLRSKFDSETWLALSGEIQDVLREQKRDALAAYLLAQTPPPDAPSGKWENSNDLYAYYLLDVEMCSCQLTSRLVGEASGSAQLFVQRCFMGLEPAVVVEPGGVNGDSAWRWWQWMRKYRVWEANRKVFLWPENWIAPELKKDRSSFFKDLENELLQNEVNQYNVETAFTNYLEKLDGVAQLEIAGFYQEDDGDNAIVHVFGRTRGAEPHLYYYRRYDYHQWTPWEKVELDIQGDYLIPAVIAGRLFLFWPVFTEVPDDLSNNTVQTPHADEQAALPPVTKKLRMQMAVSDYRLGRWSSKRVSKDADVSGIFSGEVGPKHYRFFAIDRSETDGRFGISYRGAASHSYLGKELLGAEMDGAFEIASCAGVPTFADFPGSYYPALQPETESAGFNPDFQRWMELTSRLDRDDDFTLAVLNATPDIFTFPRLLERTPGLYQMSPAWHLSYFDKLLLDGASAPTLADGTNRFAKTWVGNGLPFFYNDRKRTFFVLPCFSNRRQDGPAAAPPIEGGYAYYPDAKRQLRAAEDDYEGRVRNAVTSYKVPPAGSPARASLDQILAANFPTEPPPYVDAQIKELFVRLWMRFVRLFLGRFALSRSRERRYHFKNFYHWFVCDFLKLVANPLQGIPGLMRRETQLQESGFSFAQTYLPTSQVVDPANNDSYPKEVVDFTPDGAYSSYNWELFFHAPLLIANALSRNQRFEEARDWYHFIFNPIGVDSAMPGGSPMSKFWITAPFFRTTGAQYVQQRIDNIMGMLNGNADLESQVRDWRRYPFEPHRIANYRTVAYQKTVVMNYLDNLIAWGDFLFSQDSMESINEATQLYVMAAEILGDRPQKVPPQGKPPLLTFNELESDFDAFSNAVVQVENLVPQMSGTGSGAGNGPPLPMLYFCIPQNDKMLGYWDTVADRLYKIRHCMNIKGVVRQLALFEPPIDPGALVKAVAAGADISSALADLNAPLPIYRFTTLLAKANELCGDVKMLGGALLNALEKNDAEALSLLRQDQEIKVLEATEAVRQKQIEEANENREGIKKSKAVTEIRRNYYRDIERLSSQEKLHLDKLTESQKKQQVAQGIKLGASIISLLPAIDVGASGFGGTPLAKFKLGGLELGQAASLASDVLSFLAQIAANDATMASINAGNDRRWADWKQQEKLADKELDQFDRQIAAAEIRIAIAEKELANHLLQIENAKATDEFMRSKYTNEELYQWQVGQISGVYFESYKLAYELAKSAERCFRFELGLQDSSYISFGYWDSLKKGLLSGEKLQYDLRRLEANYLQLNARKYELTKHVSLALLDPMALIKLRETGRCFFQIPEENFDLDYPGHYFRRMMSVSLTLPCVTGPYTTISCTLRLLKNSIRINTGNGDNGYPRNVDDAGLPTNDDRFIENNIPVKSIAASNAQNDSGVFELNFRDERYLPFEGAGAISTWALELFTDLPSNNADPTKPDFGRALRQFDYDTISDAILHIRYTAREDAGAFKNGAVAHLRDYYQDKVTSSARMFDLRREFPAQWHRFLHPSDPTVDNEFELSLYPSLFPFRDSGKTLVISSTMILARCTDPSTAYTAHLETPATSSSSGPITLVPVNQYGGLLVGQDATNSAGLTVTDPPAPSKLTVTKTSGTEVEELFLIVEYSWASESS